MLEHVAQAMTVRADLGKPRLSIQPRRIPWLLRTLICALLATSAACGDDDKASRDASVADGAQTDGAVTGPATWHETVGPIVAERCGGCHSDGGIAPFRLDRADDWKVMGQPAVAAMESGTMPPWPADGACGKFEHRGDMPAEEIALVKGWVHNNRPMGDPKNATPPPQHVVITPTHTLPMKAAYTPPKEAVDTYRCFLLDLDTSQHDWFVTASQVVPGSSKLVHHVLVYNLEGDLITASEEADKAEPGPGYTCFGSPLPATADGNSPNFSSGFPNQLAAWVPGVQPRVLPKDYAIRLKKGSRIVMQVHYNVPAGETEPDTTRLDMVLTKEPPKRIVVTRPLVIQDLNIPPGEKNVAHETVYRYFGQGEVRVHSLSPHMHLLGSSFKSEIVRANGSKECALSVPKWDFGWQQSYARPESAPIVLKDGDGVSLRCVYDNTQTNQPRINGKQITPKKVTWGEGSFDEMCMVYLDMSEPYEEGLTAGATPCTGFDACQKSCDPSRPSDCLFSCDKVESACGTCAVSKLISCSGATCGGALIAAKACLTNCLTSALMLGTNPGACMAAQCPQKWSKLQACLDPKIAQGDCNQALAACGVGFGAK